MSFLWTVSSPLRRTSAGDPRRALPPLPDVLLPLAPAALPILPLQEDFRRPQLEEFLPEFSCGEAPAHLVPSDYRAELEDDEEVEEGEFLDPLPLEEQDDEGWDEDFDDEFDDDFEEDLDREMERELAERFGESTEDLPADDDDDAFDEELESDD